MPRQPWRRHVRLVLDTNILVSGLLSPKGPPGTLVAAWLDLRFELVTSAEQVAELRRVLAYEKLRPFLSQEQARDFVENLEALAVVAADLPLITASPDPDDNLILATAVAGRADAVVSGDKAHLLVLRAVEGIPILSARAAVAKLGLWRE
ncbi:MAG: putative toxin-antitoxin system toxin component, PIN family [Planctomycetes bacterium]|nr:putative toxin-antitoxin system toxin component, PIN family [Planctomycetota bacterium]